MILPKSADPQSLLEDHFEVRESGHCLILHSFSTTHRTMASQLRLEYEGALYRFGQ
jgi:hypothetical protein